MKQVPLELKIQQTEYGFRVQLPINITNTERYAYRLHRDPPGVMRVIEFNPDRSVLISEVVRRHVGGGFDVYMELLYKKSGRNWESHASNSPGVTGARLESGDDNDNTYRALDALLEASNQYNPRRIIFPPHDRKK